ncbi:hypothetical protein PHYBLDRAFT_71157 [Phycomyces blakesleeanus NRRL 1555(-)]|uniref:Rab-GAP TBC domain-containing protein n=1 Tax=Phycomyces blakesleeanus (strain ATCC 8743b / DSM 1359 / FGSC 10004 / NBRC 33097 / NRRL 1555) TaxID=763407 RepID=A0A163CX78_PHYB8|nr:hypothetical protein PHYBLDRAFT_71157 [Phycomyces blakesleeanus NRRL 1555(-)]OAD66260.1 hypothetical protein PHYBLDRAFT_71157 [Phycomyces blakesleeanus NRRL 1555(-)]|eukprot:XP_018284300.1 hypothetical protein PHYBLDRAFT_71157 [Phycomyces blakesleeanus NRRL 1555(-)]
MQLCLADPSADPPCPSNRSCDSVETRTTDLTMPSISPEQPPIEPINNYPQRELAIKRHYDQGTRPDLVAEMEKWYSMTDRYGFLQDTPITDRQRQKEVERATKWAAMAKHRVLHKEDVHYFPVTKKFIQRVYKGIPDCWRRDAWYFLCTDQLQTAAHDDKLRITYAELLLKHESDHDHQIDLDIPRTTGDHIMFKQRYGTGQKSLFNVLRAFSLYDTEVGYCQGMTNIAATILMYFEEEKAFIVLVHMFLRDNLHDLYIPGFPILMESFFIQEKLLQQYLPKLFNHLNEIGLTSDIYSTRWYITLFTGGVVRYHTLLRIWDIYFLNGFDILYVVALVLLKTFQERLLKGDLELCMELLGSVMTVDDDDQFIATVRRLHDKIQYRGLLETIRNQYKSNSINNNNNI